MRLAIVTLAALAVSLPAASHAQDLEASTGATVSATSADLARASKMWVSGDHAGAVRVWRGLTDSRDAHYNLGQAYRLGRGVPTDLGMARVFYERALTAGHPKAAEQLGLLLFNDASTRASAVPFLMQAAANGSPRAEMALGLWNLEGSDKPNLEVARVHLTNASEARIPGAAAALAKLSLRAGVNPASMSEAERSSMAAASVAEAALAAMGSAQMPTIALAQPVRVAVATPAPAVSVATMGLPADGPVVAVASPVVQAIPRPAHRPPVVAVPSRPVAVRAVPVPPRTIVQVEASDEVMVFSSPSGNYSRKVLPSDAARPAPVVIWWQ